jgi:hypothetical protein
MSSTQSNRYTELQKLILKAQKLLSELEHRQLHETYPTEKLRLEIDIANTKAAIKEHEAELEDLKERLKPIASIPPSKAHLSSGQDWPDNPFTSVLRVTDSHFVGREAMLRRLRNVLNSSSIHLLGPSKIGKSSLLWLLYQTQLKQGVKAVFGDFQQQEMNEIMSEVAEMVGQPPDVSWPVLRRELLTQPFCLFLDELDFAPKRGFDLEWGRRFRTMSNSKFRLVTGGRRSPKNILEHSDVDSEWFNFLTPEILGPLTPTEAERLLTCRLNTPINTQIFTPEVCQELIKLSQCHPFKLMRAAYHYYDQQTNDPDHDWLAYYNEDLKHFGME